MNATSISVFYREQGWPWDFPPPPPEPKFPPSSIMNPVQEYIIRKRRGCQTPYIQRVVCFKKVTYQEFKWAICIGNHTHSSPIREIIVLAIVKIGRGEAESDFYYCVYNYSLIGQKCVCLPINRIVQVSFSW